MKWVGLGFLLQGVTLAQVAGILQAGAKPLIGVAVWWSGRAEGTITDTLGRFVLPEPPYYPIYLRAAGGLDSLLVKGKPEGLLLWELAPSLEVAPQTIMAQQPARTLSSQSPQATETWSRLALTAAPCCNLSEAFQGSALIDATLEGSAMGLRRLRLLGLEPAHTPLLWENKPLSWGLGRSWSSSLLPAFWIDHLAIAKGVGSVMQGPEGLGGQVQVFLLPEREMRASALELFTRSTGEVLGAWCFHDTAGRWKHLWLGQGGGTPWESAFLQDHNGDGFLDVPLYRQVQTHLKLYQRHATGSFVEWEVGGLYDARRSGQLFVSSPQMVAEMRGWGAFQTIKHFCASGRRGWVWEKGRGLSVLWQGRYWEQSAYPGFPSYEGRMPTGWLNLLYRQPLGDTRLIWQVGLSGYVNRSEERLVDPIRLDTSWRRTEWVPGAASELTWTPTVRLSAVLGVRADWHSYYGWQGIPRLHLRWAYSEWGAIRLSGGRAWRIPDPVAEQLPLLFSARTWHFEWSGWPPLESGWSSGFFWTQGLMIGRGTLRWQIDGLLARLNNMAVPDIEDPWQVRLYKGEAPATYQTLFVELHYDWQDQVRLSMSYKRQAVWWPIRGQRTFRPLLPRDRFVLWLTANPLSRRWQVDLLAAYTGWIRVPSTAANPEPHQRAATGGFFWIVTPQLTYRIDQWEAQIAVENLFNYRQPQPVIATDKPLGPYFDHSLIWGPIMGRMASLTFRYHW